MIIDDAVNGISDIIVWLKETVSEVWTAIQGGCSWLYHRQWSAEDFALIIGGICIIGAFHFVKCSLKMRFAVKKDTKDEG